MRSTTRIVLSAILAVLLALPAAALPRPKERWQRFESPSFVFFSSASPKHTREIAAGLEYLRAALGALSEGARLNTPLPTYIYVFEHDRAFRPYKLIYDGKPAKISGYFVAHEHGNYVAIDGSPESDPLRIVYHEYLHYFLRNNFPTVPLWLNEGMAELYSNFEVVRGRAKIGLPLRDHLLTLRRYGMMPLAELLEIDRDSPSYNEGLRQGVFYAQTWLLAHYLLIGNAERAAETRGYLEALERNEPPAAAFRRIFGDDLKDLERELDAYLRGYQMGFVELSLEDEVVTEVTASELSRVETLFRLGDLLLHADAGHAGAAREHLERALELDPDHAPTLAALGFLAEESGEPKRALALLARAAALAPGEPRVQFLYGLSLVRSLPASLTPRDATDAERTALERAREAFSKSVARDPANAEAWANLGYTYTLDDRPPARAVEALETAHRLLPARADVAYNLLLVHTRLGNRERARALHDRIVALGADETTVAQAREALLGIEVAEINDLLAAQRLTEALPRVEAILAQTTDPVLRRELASQLEELRHTVEHNRFVERYNEAARLANQKEYAGAIEVLENLLETVEPGPDRDDVLYLLEEVRTLRAAQRR